MSAENEVNFVENAGACSKYSVTVGRPRRLGPAELMFGVGQILPPQPIYS